jgi:hypothetical protein
LVLFSIKTKKVLKLSFKEENIPIFIACLVLQGAIQIIRTLYDVAGVDLNFC